MKLYFAMATRKGIYPECFVSMRKLGIAEHLNVSNQAPLALARNELVDDFLSSDAESLVWIDDDHLLPENFGEYLEMPHSVCAPLSYSNIEGNVVPSVWNWKGDAEFAPVEMPDREAMETPFIEADVVTGSGYKLGRDIVEEFMDEHRNLYYDDWVDEKGIVRYGEDIYLFSELRKKHRRITVHTDVGVGHMQLVDLSRVRTKEVGR